MPNLRQKNIPPMPVTTRPGYETWLREASIEDLYREFYVEEKTMTHKHRIFIQELFYRYEKLNTPIMMEFDEDTPTVTKKPSAKPDRIKTGGFW